MYYFPKYEGIQQAPLRLPPGYYTSDIPTDEFLHVNECGYTEAQENDILCCRPKRRDFELFYIRSGEILFHINGTEQKATKGQIAILKPGDTHNFIHFAEQKAKSFWMHFTGTGAADLLKNLNLWNESIYTVGINSESENIFSKIFQELRLEKPNNDKMCVGFLLQLLTLFSRLSSFRGSKIYHNNYEILDPVIEDMYNNFHSNYENSDYAKMCNLSTSHFIALFKQRTGLPPLVYRQSLRMEKAKNLLLTTDLPIKEIANMTGYSDPLYFNRIFRKKNGMPPGDFRANNRVFDYEHMYD